MSPTIAASTTPPSKNLAAMTATVTHESQGKRASKTGGSCPP